MLRLSLMAVLALSTAASAASTPAQVSITPVARVHDTVTGQPLVIPPNPDVVVSIGTFPPGARLPVHKHPYPHLVYVLDGVLTVTNVEANKTFDVRKGDFLAEMQNTWHYGINNGKTPVKLLIIDEEPRGTATNVVPRK